MSNKSGSPHDAVVRAILGEPPTAASALRALLPAMLASQIDLSQLTRVPGSFVDTNLTWRHVDLLFTAPLNDEPAFIYVLVEHQSSPERLMAYRMYRYRGRIWDEYLRQHPGADRLPAIIPLVIYHDRRSWTAPTQMLDLINLGPDGLQAALDYLPRQAFLLDDLTSVDEQALRARPLNPPARLTLLFLKIAPGNPRIAHDLRPWLDQLLATLAEPGGKERFTALISYALKVGETPAEDFQDLINKLGPEAEEALMTTAEMLRAEGEARGRAEGEARGRAEGRAEMLIELLTTKFGPLPQTAVDTVHAATADQLRTWIVRVLSADTLEQALR